jgi:hypothetical protein
VPFSPAFSISKAAAFKRIQSLVDGYTAGPALVYDSLFDLVVFNSMADFVYRFNGYAI